MGSDDLIRTILIKKKKRLELVRNYAHKLYPIASNSRCCWCVQTCKLAALRVAYTQRTTMKSPDFPLSKTSEAATAWAETCSQQDWQNWEDWRRCSLLETQMTEAELESGHGFGSRDSCMFFAGTGGRPRPSTQPAALAVLCAGLPGAHWRRCCAGGSGRQKLHPPGQGDVVRQPPRERWVCGPSLAMTPVLLRT